MKKLNNKGFSLVELLVAITVLAIVTVPLLRTFVTSAKTAARSRQMGNATIVGKSLAEVVESNAFAAILAEPDKVFQSFNMDSVGYGESGGLDYEGIDPEAPKQQICLNGVQLHDEEDSVKFNARITLNAGEAAEDLYTERNAKKLSEYGDMDHVHAQDRSDPNDPDAQAYAEFVRDANSTHLSPNSTWYENSVKVSRQLYMDVKKDAGKFHATLTYKYTFNYEYTDNTLVDGNYVPGNRKTASILEEYAFDLFPHGFACDLTDEDSCPTIYLMYYPMYDNLHTGMGNVVTDDIYINNPYNIPFTLFLVKQIEPNVQLNTLENQDYTSLIVQYQDYIASADGHYEPAAQIYSNAREMLTDSDNTLMNVNYRLFLGEHLSQNEQFAGQGFNSLVELNPKNRLYEVTVDIFMTDDSYTAEPLYTFKSTKLQ